MTRSFKLTIAYDGTEFCGWQVQPNGPSVQAALLDALAKATGQTNEMSGKPASASTSAIRLMGSGRTDAGVHAIAQVASCQMNNWKHDSTDLQKAVNRHLPDSIIVNGLEDAPDGFHAIGDAIGKRYRYQIQLGGLRDPFAYRYVWQLRHTLDLDAIRLAASHIVGRRDFACFQAAGSDRESTVRDVRACDIIERTRDAHADSPSGPLQRQHGNQDHEKRGHEKRVQRNTSEPLRFDIEIEADGFLYNMVRNIVGTLVEVGSGKRTPESIKDLILSRDRNLAGPTSPACGLFLLRVDYEDVGHKS